jgi:hypothetical protein
MCDENHVYNWLGVSVQQESINAYELSRKNIPLNERTLLTPDPPNSSVVIENFKNLVMTLVNNASSNSEWIILRDSNRKKWISNVQETSFIKSNIINIFKKENIDLNYRGAFLLSSFSLIKILSDLIAFSYYNKSEDINLLNDKSNYIIRFTHHFSIDFISIEKKDVDNFVLTAQKAKFFKIKAYN